MRKGLLMRIYIRPILHLQGAFTTGLRVWICQKPKTLSKYGTHLIQVMIQFFLPNAQITVIYLKQNDPNKHNLTH